MKKLFYLLIFYGTTLSSYSQLPQLKINQLCNGLNKPLDVKNCGDDRIFIVEQPGFIHIVNKAGNVRPIPFLDISSEVEVSSEQGLLSVAFSPNYKQDGYFYVNYIFGTSGSGGNTRISRFHVSAADSNVADVSSEKILLTFTQPYTNHKGATLMFGNDGYLYDSQGDGGSGGDPLANGQNTNVFLGKILRLDVSNPDTTYTIPPTNPFYGNTSAKQEIWAYGLRNPFRCSFDRITHDLWIGDVGQSLYEEIDFQPAADTGGQNYGWRCYEGLHTYNAVGCAAGGFTLPVYEYGHSTPNGCAVIGGHVYRGAQFSSLWGLYLFSDACSERFWSLKQTSPGVFDPDTLQSFAVGEIGGIGEDNEGELYIAFVGTGQVFRLTETSNCNPVAYVLAHDSISCGSITLTALKGDTLSYQWYNQDGLITGATNNQYRVTTAGFYKVQVSKVRQGCQAMSDSFYMQPYDSTALINTASRANYCITQGNVDLTGFVTPTGGVFNGTGISGNIFTPSQAGLGPDTILYNYVNANSCSSTSVFIAQVGDTTTFTDQFTDTVICGGALVNLQSFVLPLGGTYSGIGVINDSTFNSLVGHATIYYQYTNNYGCVGVDSFQLSVAICDGINKLTNALNAEIYPNPNNGNFELKAFSAQREDVEIEITDVVGQSCLLMRSVLMPEVSTIPIGLPNLAKGMYILQLKGSGEIYSQRFLVN